MRRHYTLLSLLSAFIVATAVFGGYMNFKSTGMPVVVTAIDAHTAVIGPINGIPMPAGLQAGDRIDLEALSTPSRMAISINTLSAQLAGNLPLGHTYDLVIERGDARVTVPVTTVDLSQGIDIPFFQWITFFNIVLTAGLALLVIWRGRDRAATGMAIWTVAAMAANGNVYPLDGTAGFIALLATNLTYLLARLGFYVMADAIARPVLSPRIRAMYLAVFMLVLVSGAALVTVGGPPIYVLTGWAGSLIPSCGILWTASYFIPILLLFSSYRHATAAQQLRLRWMLWSSVAWLSSIFISNTPLLGLHLSLLVTDILSVLSIAGFLYAVLRHRVVDVSVLLDSTLVYGSMTALVVGVLAAVNSLVQHAALGTSASLLLQVAVPLSLGIVLTRVRGYLDRVVEQVFFRKKYQAAKALRRFARVSSGYEHADELMRTAIADIRQHLGARGVAIYERAGAGYHCVRQAGEVSYPEQVKIDDMAFVAARAEQEDIDLLELSSALGNDGAVFPLLAHGEIQAVLVCANRPGERYPADERALLALVAQQMGMALYALRMRAKAKVVEALVKAPLTALPEVQSQARMLLSTAMG